MDPVHSKRRLENNVCSKGFYIMYLFDMATPKLELDSNTLFMGTLWPMLCLFQYFQSKKVLCSQDKSKRCSRSSL